MTFCKPKGCALAVCALAVTLGACGGAFEEDFGIVVPSAGTPFAALPPLLQDDGTPSAPLPSARPARGDELTRAGLYALRAQAQALEHALHDDVIWIGRDCCAHDDAEQVLGLVAGLMAVRDLGAGAPVFVDLPDRRSGAAIANRLSDAGYTRVFLVTD